MDSQLTMEVGRSSGGRALACKGWDHLIEPAWWVHLQLGLFSIPTSGPQLVHQWLWFVLSCMWESAYKRSLAVYRKDKIMWHQQVSSKEIFHNDRCPIANNMKINVL